MCRAAYCISAGPSKQPSLPDTRSYNLALTQRALHGMLARMLNLAEQGARQEPVAGQQVAQVHPELHALPLAQLPRRLQPK